MSHHSQDIEATDQLIKLFAEELKLGATGDFPDGSLHKTDEGEIKIGITERDGRVILAFGKPVALIGFEPNQADEIARLLITRAIEARKQ